MRSYEEEFVDDNGIPIFDEDWATQAISIRIINRNTGTDSEKFFQLRDAISDIDKFDKAMELFLWTYLQLQEESLRKELFGNKENRKNPLP